MHAFAKMGSVVLALAAAMATPAVAQDRTFDWSGFYVGAGGGYAFGGANFNFAQAAGGGGPPGQWAPDATGGSFFSSGTVIADS